MVLKVIIFIYLPETVALEYCNNIVEIESGQIIEIDKRGLEKFIDIQKIMIIYVRLNLFIL